MGGMGDVQPFDMPPTQQVPFYPAQQQGGAVNPNILSMLMGQQQMPPNAMMPPQMTGGIRQPQIYPTRVPVDGDGQPVRPGMNPFMGNLGGNNYPMPQRAPIERPMLPPEVVDALRLAMQGQMQQPMGQGPAPGGLNVRRRFPFY